jgi:cytochrome b
VVALVAAAWWTQSERMLDWHRLIGYTLLALILFRLSWGLFGSTTARFAGFVRAPRAVYHYVRHDFIRREPAAHPGHNPLGGWSVILMLALLLSQVGLGMFAVDVDGIESGPLSYLVTFETGRLASRLHGLGFNILLGVIVLHVIAVLFYHTHKRDNLILPMLIGRRGWTGEQPMLRFAPLPLAIALLAICAVTVWAFVKYLGRV